MFSAPYTHLPQGGKARGHNYPTLFRFTLVVRKRTPKKHFDEFTYLLVAKLVPRRGGIVEQVSELE
jgi:hypothetical protein